MVAGGLLLVVGGVLLFLAASQEDERSPVRAPQRAKAAAKPCPRQSVRLRDGSSRDPGGAADAEGVRRPSARRLAATALTIAAGAGAAAPPEADAARARPADGFVDSIGVNVHLSYGNTPYRRHDIVQKKLIRLGVRYVRDHLFPNRPDMYQTLRSLASCGIKVNLIVGDPLRRWTIGSLGSQLAVIEKENLGEAIESLEGPNEYDNQGDRNWAPVLRDYQRRFYTAVKSDPELRGYPVLGPSLVNPPSNGLLGDISRSLDFGNVHPYPGGRQPDGEGSSLAYQLRLATRNSRSKPVQVTETGYHNGVRSTAPHFPATERVAAVYMPRLFFDYHRRGIARTYSYELLDQRPDPERVDSEANFGLLRNDYSEKPAYTALRRTIDLLSDPGPGFKTAALDYSISGAASGVERTLLQKRDGTFYLALWKDETVWDPNPGARHAVRSEAQTVRVSLGQRARRIEVYRPSDSAGAVKASANARSVSLEASASVAIVKITPAAASRGTSAPYKRLGGKERRVARTLMHLRSPNRAHRSGLNLRIRRLSRWLARRSHRIRRRAHRSGWAPSNRRVRYRAIRTVLRRA